MTQRQQAEALASRIRAYWSARGASPHVWAEPSRVYVSGTDSRLYWQVRSDIVGGWPKAGPASVSKFVPGLIADSATAKRTFPAIRQPATKTESVRPFEALWREALHV